MSEDSYGLDKAARLAARRETEEAETAQPLDPEFPFEIEAFEPEFWNVQELAEEL